MVLSVLLHLLYLLHSLYSQYHCTLCTIVIQYYDQMPGIFVWQEGQVPPEVTWFSMI
jgi:hypothetical protein